MAHSQEILFVKTVAFYIAKNYSKTKILELGSYDVNGSIRSLFPDSDYTGIDLIKGPGVDRIADAHLVDYPENFFDICISCECFEHNPKWFETFQNMHRMTKEGGMIILTCASTARVEHGTKRTNSIHSPGTQEQGSDYYKNLTKKDFTSKLYISNLFQNHFFKYNKYSQDLYFVGIKSGGNSIFMCDLDLLYKEFKILSRITHQQEHHFIYRAYRFILDLPIYLASFLPEKYFQDFAVPYRKLTSQVKKLLFANLN